MSIFIHRRLLLFLCFMGLTAVLVTAVGAQPAPPPIFERAELPYLPSYQPAPQNLPSQTYNYTDWESWPSQWVSIAYQKLEGNNWDIYARHRQLTTHGASDVYPAVDPTGRLIAFSSDRLGTGFEIFLMWDDSSGQHAITQNTADDVRPAWSPDGEKIAFQSYRDGRAEVYVMNKDGSRQTRLTHSLGSGLPAWSPDGKQIAFTSVAANGNAYVHIMDKNGQNVRQLATDPSSYPVWSPDGKYIAYSADWDRDGWLDLMIMNADGSAPRPLYNSEGGADVWVSSWAPNSEYLYFTKIFYVYYQGNWYWTQAQIGALDLFSGAPEIQTSGLIWNPNIQSSDHTAPIIDLDQLHRYTSAQDPLLLWPAEDMRHMTTATSGVKSYDVQHFTNPEDAWQDWLIKTTEDHGEYPAVPGQTVYFRAQATDNASNVSKWGQTSTTFYSGISQGQLMDNRGAPLQQASFTVLPSPISQTQTNDQGNFLFYLQQAGTHLLDIVRDGYGDFLETAVRLPSLGQLYLPPADNVIVNGEFETAVPLDHWQVGGDLPVTAVDNSYTGQQAILLNNTTCDAGCNSQLYQLPEHVSMVMGSDSKGDLHVIYGHDKYIIQTDEGWSDLQPLPDGYRLLSSHLFLIDELLYLIWNDRAGYESNLWYSTKPIDGEWSEPAPFIDTHPEDITNLSVTTIVKNASDLFHAVVKYRVDGVLGTYYYQQYADGSWSKAIPVTVDSTVGIKLAALPDNTVLLFDQNHRVNNAYRVAVSRLTGNNSWGNITTLSEPYNNKVSSVAVDLEGTIHLFAEPRNSSGHFLYLSKPLGGAWTEASHIGNYIGASSFNSPILTAVDSKNRLHFMASKLVGGHYDLYHAILDETGWHTEITETTSSIKQFYIDAYDNMYLYFQDQTVHHNYATFAGTAVISQTVTIPANMVAPTLSFMTHQVGSPALTVWVDDGTTATAVPLSSRGAAKWHQAWADLTPWTGQTVTLAFELNQEVGDPLSQIMLDSISLGSAYPDSWVRATSTLDTQPGETVQLQIDYGNSSGLDSNGAVLHVTLPDDLSFVSASTPPTSQVDGQLNWQIGDLPAHTAVTRLVITATVATDMAGAVTVPIALQTAVAERETANNQAQTTVRIRYYQYLPLLLRP